MKKYIFILIIFVITFSSCKKSFLDEESYSNYSAATLNDSLGYEASIVGLYNHLSNFYTWSDHQGWLCVWQVGTDIAYGGQPEAIEIPYYNYGTLISTDGAAGYTWNWAYRMINNANIIIENVEKPGVPMGQKNIKAISGEARFFRAFAYEILATCFGKVPVITSALTAPKTDFVREPITVVNSLIESDLILASQNLPDIDNVKKSSTGKVLYARANNAMAQQLLATSYLRQGKPDLAEAQCAAIIGSKKFLLTTGRYGVKAALGGTPFADMFIYGNQRRGQGNKEAIWVLEQENPASVPGGYTGNPQQRRVWQAAIHNVTGMALCDSLGGRGLARIRLNNWVLYGIYEPTDMRNSPYSIRRNYWYNDITKPALYGQKVPMTGFDTIYNTCPEITKWAAFDPNDSYGYATIKDFILMRLGETYLLQAEAQFQQGKLVEAANSINVIRGRANATLISSADVTMDFILDERARELVGEENRRMTLMRTGTLVDRATRLNHDVNSRNLLNGITPKNLLMPIPQAEIDLNKDAVLEQNPGY